jgi:bifunctional N-acetylglucosamine-1-phosphate-uridyltransferase/glucosamine-1-phosphate-acetyltransferase GlmU-like protein
MNADLEIIILAGGKGKRMQSDVPKPLHPVGEIPTINRIVESALPLSKEPIIVIGDHSRAIMDVTGNKYHYVLQREQRGTGHAVLVVRDTLKEFRFGPNIMVIPGDHPLVTTKTLQDIVRIHRENNASITIGTITVPSFDGDYECFSHYGRVKRDPNGKINAITEVKDATPEEKMIHEVNLSYYCFKTEWLWNNIHNLNDKNAARELYLTDMVRLAVEQNIPVFSSSIGDFREGMGFNTPEELARIRSVAQ